MRPDPSPPRTPEPGEPSRLSDGDSKRTLSTQLPPSAGDAPPFDPLPEALSGSKKIRLLQKLGEGGMGAVYRAEQVKLKRVVVVKVIRPALLADPDALRRFQDEAEAVARLRHPNIVTTHDSDEEGGLHFLVMELVDGTDLAKLVRQEGPLAIGRACDYVRQAATGLQHAHDQGVIHRDVKPQNLMASPDGRVTVLDFGLARVTREAGVPASVSGQVLGTPDYMSPEQARSPKSLDGRADVYSLGCTLFYLLTGRSPFPRETVMEVLIAHHNDPPPSLRAQRPDAPPELAALVERMLAKRPADRPATPGEVALALEPFLGIVDPPPAEVAEQEPHGLLAQICTFLTIAVILAVAYLAVFGMPTVSEPKPDPKPKRTREG